MTTPAVSVTDLAKRFTFTEPASEDISDLHDDIREQCLGLAEFFNDKCPAGRELSTAIARVEEAMFWANAAVARNSSS